MLLPFRYFFWFFAKLFLSLRYRVRVVGLDKLGNLKGPALLLPNHPGYIDPPLVLTTLWPRFKPRPLLWEGMFRNPIMYPCMKLVEAVRVPGIDQASQEARAKTEQALQGVIEGLKEGRNHLLWPAGRVERTGVERLGGARALTDILAGAPEAEIILIRTRGVWGSMFSYAMTGSAPSLGKGLLSGLSLLLANFLFFAPRREITITLERIDRTRLPELKREKVNPFFEALYNAEGPETPKYVSYHFLFGPRTYEYPKPASLAEVDLSGVKPQTKEAVSHIIEEKLHRPLAKEEGQPETTLDHLGLDSLDRMEITLRVEQQFGFFGDQVPTNIGQLWALAEGLVEKAPPKPPPPAWFREPAPDPLEVIGETIPEGFLNRALKNRFDVAVADDLAGVLTFEKLLVASLTMARRFKKIQAPNVGVLLPASVAGDIVFLALQLAGKLPVMLNWTTGPANLAHAARVMSLTHVITSRQFLDRTGITVEGVEYLFLEIVKESIGKFDLLKTLFRVRFAPGRIRKKVPKVSPDQPAVVLFTSGSEKAPKAVPLTHANIISDERLAIPLLDLTRRDIFLGFLPPFHSFGLAVTTLMPILAGMRVVHHPDPTDAGGLARKIASYKPTLLVGTPTFVSFILDRAQPEDLKSLRLIVTGAEKCPETLMERCAHDVPHALILEGYGITECSPVVAVNTPTAHRPGTLGKPLSGLDALVVDLETGEELPPNKMGMLWVSGPTVFPGYIAHDGPSPFQERHGKRWYVTGDLVKIDNDGFIHFNGRLKRFLKAGGEMISLPALEEPFSKLYPPTKDGPRVAVEGVDNHGARSIVLFTTEPFSLREANALLLQEGFRGVMRLDEVRQVPTVPVLGTGKTDYKVLKKMIEDGNGARDGKLQRQAESQKV